MSTPLIEMQGVHTWFGENHVHNDINLSINAGEIFAIVGGSGSGKTTLLRILLMLLPPAEGKVKIFGEDIFAASEQWKDGLRKKWGVLFQSGALFSSLKAWENVAFPLQEHTQLLRGYQESIARLTLRLVGLSDSAADSYPSELSGGMIKRAALARAIVLNPGLLFLDEPTAGLDPVSAHAFDELVLQLRDALGLTVVMVTHDIDTLRKAADRIAFLGEGKVLECGTMATLIESKQPMLQAYFQGERGRK